MHLGADEVHVWLIEPSVLDEPTVAKRCLDTVSAPERARAQRFHFDADRALYLAAHTLARNALSRYADVPPREWRFETNEYGRPAIAAGVTELPLQFNISHTAGLAACAISLAREVGVDVERRVPRHASMEVAAAHFSSDELAALSALASDDRVFAFYRYWTLKEAYIKARGMGLALPLDQFSFSDAADTPIRIRFGPGIRDTPADWQFLEQSPTEHHALALAARRAGSPRVRITVHRQPLFAANAQSA